MYDRDMMMPHALRSLVLAFLLVGVGGAEAAADVELGLGGAFASDPIRIKTEHPKSPVWSTRWLLDMLTGIEANLTFGNASLSHKVRNENGIKLPVAHGYNDFTGFGVGLMDAPRRTSVGLRPDFGFFSKRLIVRGFEQGIPWQEGALDLAGTCSDVETGERVDCRKVYDYDLRTRAIYLGPQIFGAVVVANSWLELFLQGTGALRLAEFRWLNVEAANMRHKNARLAFLRSVTTGGAIGATFPRQHVSVRISVDYEYYFRFRYPVPLEFEGPISYDAARDIYLRPRVRVDDASISTISATLAAGFLF